jgi:phasin family protein
MAIFPLLPDIDDLVRQFSLPNVDIASLVESRRKDMEALVEANRRAYEGMQALGQRQLEILQESMRQLQDQIRQAGTGTGAANDAAVNLGESVRLAFERALTNMRELAEMAAKAQSDAYEVIHQRVQESLEETGRQFQVKRSSD